MNCTHCRGAEALFDERVAKRDLRSYRKKGPSTTTRILLDAVLERGVERATLLDIGGGVGAIPNALLAAGAASAIAVDASTAYLEASREEAERQGHADRLRHMHGDFVELAPRIEPADIVTLDRVICCYPDMEALVGASAERARRLYGVVYPRDTWWTRAGLSLANLALRLLRRSFRAFVHAPEAVEEVVTSRGLVRSFHRETTIWRVSVFERRG